MVFSELHHYRVTATSAYLSSYNDPSNSLLPSLPVPQDNTSSDYISSHNLSYDGILELDASKYHNKLFQVFMMDS